MPRATGAPEVHGVVFDLDGTLVDAFPGLTTAANAARAAVRVVLVGGGAAPVRELRATGATVLARLYDLVSMLGLDAPGGKPR